MKRILIDSNALTLFVLGTVNQHYIGRHRRLSIYDEDDFGLLSLYISNCKEVVITPNIWTEVDNLCHDQIHGEDKTTYISLMQKIHTDWIPGFVEEFVRTMDAVRMTEYSYIGLSDTVILKLSKDCDLLITADSQLSDLARAQGIQVLDLKAEVTRKALL